jgi:hypothetical protein
VPPAAAPAAAAAANLAAAPESARTAREHQRLQLCCQLLHLLQGIANQQRLLLRCFCHSPLSAALLLLLLLLLLRCALEWYRRGLLYQLNKRPNCHISLR